MADSSTIDISVTEQEFPPYDAAHGTPHAMVQRALNIRVRRASASFEQTDYGHPGRFNAWSPRGIDPGLQPRTNDLLALCDAVTPLLG